MSPTPHAIVDREGVKRPLELDPLRMAVRAALGGTHGLPVPTLPWHIIWVLLGRAGVVLVRRERRGKTEVQIAEPRTVNQDVTLAMGDGTLQRVSFYRLSLAQRWARVYLMWRAFAVIWCFNAIRPALVWWQELRFRARARLWRMWVRWKLRREA